MQKILSVYAEEFNHKHGYNGHLFEGRYTASLIEDERYFLEVSRYIHLNPVKAMMVRESGAYPYSSYRLFLEGKWGRPREWVGGCLEPAHFRADGYFAGLVLLQSYSF